MNPLSQAVKDTVFAKETQVALVHNHILTTHLGELAPGAEFGITANST